MPAQRISEIVAGRRAITADTDLRLCRFFGLSNGYWLRAQAAYDTEVAEDALSDTLPKMKPWQGGFHGWATIHKIFSSRYFGPERLGKFRSLLKYVNS